MHWRVGTPRIRFKPLLALLIALTLIAITLLLPTYRSPAPKLPYDLDSLVFTADDIVEGQVVQPNDEPMAVNITAVISGTLRVGQTIRPDKLFTHLKPGTDYWGKTRAPLQLGDRLVLFLEDHPKLTCVNEGMFLVVHGNICRIGVEPQMGWMDWMPPRLTRLSPTRRELIAAIATLLPRAARWHAMIDEPTNTESIASLFSLLKQRAKPWPGYGWRDDISAAAVRRLSATGDPEIADRAIVASGGVQYFWFNPVFLSPRGRDFLLSRIADPGVDVQHRLMLARFLERAGAVYASPRAQAATRPWSPGSAPDPRNSAYLTRIARVAAGTARENGEVCAAVLEALGQLAQRGWNFETRDPEIQADIDGAIAVLQQLYNAPGITDTVLFAIEKTVAVIDYDAYLGLHSKCGPILTLAEPPDLTHYAVPSTPSILLGAQFACPLPYVNGRAPTAPKVTAAYLILTPVAGGAEYAIPDTVAMRFAGSSGSGIYCVPLPAGFVPGHYEMHYRLMDGNTIVSDGHGFQTWLPRPTVAALPRAAPRASPRLHFEWPDSWNIKLEILGALIAVLLLKRQILRSHRRVMWFRSGCCHQCGYDLRASHGKCSECGTIIPPSLRVQLFRRRLIRLAGAACAASFIGLVVLDVRSYFTGDVITRTTYWRADTMYVTRGVAVVQWLTVGNEIGWTYQRESPTDLPRSASEAGPPADRRLLGFEFSAAANLIVVPLWMPLLATVLISSILFPRGKPKSIGRSEKMAFPQSG